MRPKIKRKISSIHGASHFTPIMHHSEPVEEICLGADELEALMLKDLQGLEQKKAAAQMGISQPTFHRILLKARKKLADAVVNGKQLKIERQPEANR